MIRYKLTDKNIQTYNGFQWVIGRREVITKTGYELCSDAVFHGYHSLAQAVLFNPIHANYQNARGFKCEVDSIISDDKLKFGCKEMTLLEELHLPIFTTEQKVKFAILCAKKVCKYTGWNKWADDWLSGKNRAADTAYAAADATHTASAIHAARAAAYAANADFAAANTAFHAAAHDGIDFEGIIKQIL